MRLKRHVIAQPSSQIASPGAGGINHHWRFERCKRGLDQPKALSALYPCDGPPFMKPNAQRFGAALERHGGAERQSRTIAINMQRSNAIVCHGRQEVTKAFAVNDLFMSEAKRFQLCNTGPCLIQFSLAARHLEVTRPRKATIVVDQARHVLPEFPSGLGNGYFRHITAKPAHAAGINTGRVAGHVVFFKNDNLDASPGQLQRRRTAVDTATNDNGVSGINVSPHWPAGRPPCRPTLPEGWA